MSMLNGSMDRVYHGGDRLDAVFHGADKIWPAAAAAGAGVTVSCPITDNGYHTYQFIVNSDYKALIETGNFWCHPSASWGANSLINLSRIDGSRSGPPARFRLTLEVIATGDHYSSRTGMIYLNIGDGCTLTNVSGPPSDPTNSDRVVIPPGTYTVVLDVETHGLCYLDTAASPEHGGGTLEYRSLTIETLP